MFNLKFIKTINCYKEEDGGVTGLKLHGTISAAVEHQK